MKNKLHFLNEKSKILSSLCGRELEIKNVVEWVSNKRKVICKNCWKKLIGGLS